MNNKILLLTHHYINNHKSIDQNYIISIIKIISQEYQVEDMIKRITFPIHTTSYFKHSKKELGINYRNIEKYCVHNFNNATNINCYLLIYFITLEVIFHEMHHILQWKKIYNPDNSFESILIQLSFISANKIYYLQQNYKEFKYNIYQEYIKKDTFYLLTPTERMANIRATKKIGKLCNNFDESIYNYFKEKHLLYIKHGYTNDLSSCPLEQFLIKRQTIATKSNFKLNDQITSDTLNYINHCSLNQKLLYGLPIDDMVNNYQKIKIRN